jgi:cellulose synthase/poly-beta-1,6-N-acetylglucosamine synthase-like glycosyltransferase
VDYLTVTVLHIPLIIVVIFYTIYGIIALIIGKESRYLSILNEIKDRYYKPFISIVIPTYNEENIIRAKLENTVNTDYPKDRLEIIVIDSSTDRTPDIVEEYAKDHPYIKLVKTERQGLANALNRAYSIAKGEIVIKTDCDSMLKEDSISNIVSNFVDERVGAVTGRLMVLNNEGLESNYRSIQHRIQIAESMLDSTYIFQPFSAFKRNLIKPITTSADDADVALNIRRQGYKAIYDPTSIFYEASPLDIKERIDVKSRRAVGHINLLWKNVKLCFNPNYSWYGMLVLPMNLFMITISPILMISIPILSMIDLFVTKHSILLDYIILLSIPLILVLRDKPIASKIWTIIELQLIQLIALIRVIRYRDMRTWKRAETTRVYYKGTQIKGK